MERTIKRRILLFKDEHEALLKQAISQCRRPVDQACIILRSVILEGKQYTYDGPGYLLDEWHIYIYISLSLEELGALNGLAEKELRSTKDQIRYILRAALLGKEKQP